MIFCMSYKRIIKQKITNLCFCKKGIFKEKSLFIKTVRFTEKLL
jgi:hypothetical protein